MIAPDARVLVTGGAGFVGLHLVKRLLDDGCAVGLIDNFVSGRQEQLEPFRNREGFELFEGDLCDRGWVHDVVAHSAPALVVHLAAHHFIPFCVANPAATLRVNVLGTQHLLDAVAAMSSCRRFILASTADVYAPSERPHAESDPLAAGNVYGASKRLSEELVAFATKQCPGIRFLVARFFNIYGPGETNPHLIADILGALAAGTDVNLGNLEPRRDYVYVTDVVDALIRLGRYTGSRAVFNVGTGQGWSAKDIVQQLERILKRQIKVVVNPAKVRRVDRPALVADATLATVDLQWTARIPLAEGLRTMLAMVSIV
jgi:UDP-glucose 4-epimerase